MNVSGYNVLATLPRADAPPLLRAVRCSDRRRVLIKQADPADALAAIDLEREAAVLRELVEPGVPGLVEVIPPSSLLVLEDDGGEPLCAQIAIRPLSVPAFLALAQSLAETLCRLHRAGLIHRGLAPSAVLFQEAQGRVRLLDFAFASRIREANWTARPARLFGARIAYASPEQTGRMNRVVDHRSDLYSLGALLYHALCGTPPFQSDDPLEMVHAHIARIPLAPAAVVPGLPEPISDIVMKLLSKEAEDRYQGAAGLLADWEECAARLGHGVSAPERVEEGVQARFRPGRRDVPDRLLLPQRLYGRQDEIETLLDTFEESASGSAAWILVGGYSGVGKTALIRELHKPVARRRGIFLTGKFDQLATGTPYSALIRAFRSLVPQILGEPGARVAAVRASLREALGENLRVVCAVIPELGALVGPQEGPPAVGPTESESRFHHAFRRLLAVFARPEQPLALFLDDLQWADAATLKLLSALVLDPLAKHFLILGAYRDNEVSSDHPLMRCLDELRETGGRVRCVTLLPLALESLAAFVGDALRIDKDDAGARSLAAIIQTKTDGNPFFVTQFLKALESDGLLRFDAGLGRWGFDLERVAQAPSTDNVIDLMSRKLRRLPGETQSSLALAACIGHSFALGTLAVVREAALQDTARELWPAVAEGLIHPNTDRYEALAEAGPAAATALHVDLGYRFLHDRVQQAAYALIPRSEQERAHLRVGRLLLADVGMAALRDEQLFEIVDHLNLGRALIDDGHERASLATLNMRAGRQAKAAAAFQAALGYLEIAAALWGTRAWADDHERAYALFLELAECRSLCGRFDDAETMFAAVLGHATTRVERARVHDLRILQEEARGRYGEGMAAAREALALFDIEWPIEQGATQAALDRELDQIRLLLADRPISALLDLPPMRDPEVRVLIRLLLDLHTSLYLAGENVRTLLNCSVMVRLSLAHGNGEESAHAYMLHAMHVGQIRGDHAAAFEFGTLALRLSDRLPDRSVRAKVVMNFSWAVSIWSRPMRESFGWAREAFRLGNETGMFVDAGYAAFNETYFRLLAGGELAKVRPAVDEAAAYMRRVKMDRFVDAPMIIGRWAAALQGLTPEPTRLDGDDFSEETYERAHEGHTLFEMFERCAKLALYVTFGRCAEALPVALQAERAIRDYQGTIWDELRVFYHALALAAMYPSQSLEERTGSLGVLRALSRRLGHWAAHCPENFAAHHLLVAAEIARVDGDPGADVARLYDEAIAASASSDCPRERALANELCGRFWLERGQERVAAAYLAGARSAWAAWGAEAKVRDLDQRHARLLVSGAPTFVTAVTEAATLDFATAMKAARAISQEIERPKLSRSLVRIAMENAGAERGVLLRAAEGQLTIIAEGRLGDDGVVLPDTPAQGRTDLPASILRLVQNTGEAVSIADARAEERWLSDPYVRDTAPRSILCMPLVQQGKRMGLLYLENNLASHAFGGTRAEVLQVLASQAGVALENARLYEELQTHKERLLAENTYLQEEIRTTHNFDEIVGRSPALLDALAAVGSVAATDSTVLILGETGVGKELIARAIHSRGRRKDRPLVKVNCGAIAAGLVESELFGHVKGAFTGALQKRVGRFELADGGSIFLDEVGELPLDTQVKLLRVLQERELEPVGSNRTVKVDVRVIAATNRDLFRAVREGRFRADLLYRLNVFPLRVPALRDRRSDIPLLIAFFCESIAKKLGKTIEGFGSRDMQRLVSYSWPGNIRELQNVVERAAILARGPTLGLRPQGLGEEGDGAEQPEGDETESRTLEHVERAHIVRMLECSRGVVEGPRGAARILGLNAATLRSRMKRLGIVAHAAGSRRSSDEPGM